MSWLLVAIIAYLILAIVNLADKFILEKIIPTARTYAFLIGVSGLLIFLIAPWVLFWPGWGLFLANILTGALFSVAILFLYKALKVSEASKVLTLVGGVSPIIIFIFSFFLFKEKFSINQLIAIVLLILGTVIISYISAEKTFWSKIKKLFSTSASKQTSGVLFSLLSALFFASYWIGTKYAFNNQDFLSALIWIRLGSFLAVLFLVIRKKDRAEIKRDLIKSNQKKNNKFVFFGTQGLAAAGSILQNYAVALGSVVLVSAIQGVQYAFLLIITGLGTIFYPKIIKEDISKSVIIQKIVAIVLISMGLYLIIK